VVVVVPFHDTPDEAVGRETFGEFLALEPVADHLGVHPYAQQNAVNNSLAPHGPRTYVKGFAYQTMSSEILDYSLKKFSEFISHLGEDFVTSALIYEAYPTAKTCEVAPDATAYANRGKWYNCAMMLRWNDEKHDAWVNQWSKDFVKGVRIVDNQVVQSRGEKVLEKTSYANMPFPDATLRDAFRGNLERLTEVKMKWDPNGRFNKWFNVSPN
jgi:hypothetical protein